MGSASRLVSVGVIQPKAWTGTGTCLENHDASRQQLLADVELELSDANLLEKKVRQGIAAITISQSEALEVVVALRVVALIMRA